MPDQYCQAKIFLFEHSAQVLYNIYIDWKESQMTAADFFADFHYDQYSEFVDAELREIFRDTSAHDEIFEFDDIPF